MKIKFSGITVILAVLLIAFLLVAGCTQNAATQTGTQTPAATQTTSATSVPTGQATAAAATQTVTPTQTATPDSSDYKVDTEFEGSGDRDVSVNLKGGIVRMLTFTQPKYADSSVVITTGDAIFVFENALSKEAKAAYTGDAGKGAGTPYIWSQAFYVPQDIETAFTIDTTGDWKADVKVPLAINAIPPVSLRGLGDAASPFFQINPGDYEIDATLENADNFGVTLMSFDGKIYPLDTPKFTDAQLNGNTREVKIPFMVEDGNNYLVNVICNGKWELTLAPAGNN